MIVYYRYETVVSSYIQREVCIGTPSKLKYNKTPPVTNSNQLSIDSNGHILPELIAHSLLPPRQAGGWYMSSKLSLGMKAGQERGGNTLVNISAH